MIALRLPRTPCNRLTARRFAMVWRRRGLGRSSYAIESWQRSFSTPHLTRT